VTPDIDPRDVLITFGSSSPHPHHLSSLALSSTQYLPIHSITQIFNQTMLDVDEGTCYLIFCQVLTIVSEEPK
jgi:hypothetical protein